MVQQHIERVIISESVRELVTVAVGRYAPSH